MEGILEMWPVGPRKNDMRMNMNQSFHAEYNTV